MTILQNFGRQFQSHSTKQKIAYYVMKLLGQTSYWAERYNRHLNVGNRAVASSVFSREVLVFGVWRKG